MRGRRKVSRFATLVAVVSVIAASAAVSFFGMQATQGTRAVAIDAISEDSTCPIAGCSSNSCHGPDPAPELQPGQTMSCPRIVGCASETCHEQEKLTSHYRQANDTSLNLWIIGLGVLLVGVVSIVKKL